MRYYDRLVRTCITPCLILFPVHYRYLDYDVVRMRNNDDLIEFQRALNGSYEPIVVQPEQEEHKNAEGEKTAEPLKRSRRSLYHKNGRVYTNRKMRKVKLTLKSS